MAARPGSQPSPLVWVSLVFHVRCFAELAQLSGPATCLCLSRSKSSQVGRELVFSNRRSNKPKQRSMSSVVVLCIHIKASHHLFHHCNVVWGFSSCCCLNCDGLSLVCLLDSVQRTVRLGWLPLQREWPKDARGLLPLGFPLLLQSSQDAFNMAFTLACFGLCLVKCTTYT